MPVRTKNVDFFMIYIVTTNVAETLVLVCFFLRLSKKGAKFD